MSSRPAAMFKNLPASRILKQIERLNLIAGTPENAFKFQPNVKSIELFLLKAPVQGPHIGLKRFWRQNLPTLQFHNPDVDFIMTRIKVEDKADLKKVPARVVISGEGESKVLNCLEKSQQQILNELVELTGATSIPIEEIPIISKPDSH
ncbi:uncharacterized protein KQ657_002517 [Scheffersomyces spartinae]|uniref:Ribosomal protein/NADH dehydrogenase domain-containing protein n=1 Tax=Scheffersomyces spartinae TaxID=45513 RepID=A0A9P7V6R2_9ASCO|nr:uncharacterized protein KQ657_002517 [Scheffersomyces spartinae]KAG7192152.1 hypothetical protein KQ657_002517 [Scheffersomyces spartinae]